MNRMLNKFKKLLILLPAIILIAAGCNSNQTTQSNPSVSGENIQNQVPDNQPNQTPSINKPQAPAPTPNPIPVPSKPKPTPPPPVYNPVPYGASAKCRDGTYSYSQHRQGTCSHHGGVLIWY